MYPGLPAVASGAREAAVISETTATGPVASWRLDPNRAAIIGGRERGV
jgi:hypothetical protein